MIALILTTLTSLVAGVLIGGCSRQDDSLTRSLLIRNSQLENQASAQHDALTALAVSLVIMACGLAISIWRLKGARGRTP